MMKYLAPISFTLPSSIKHFGGALLSLPFCLMLLSCDSQSSTTAATHSASMKQSMTDVKVRANSQYDAAPLSADSDSLALADTVSGEGESLIGAAKSDDAQTRRTPMISDNRASSELQATLIGDYLGILPCSFCESIAVTLNLFSDGSVMKTSLYENPKTPTVPLIEEGVYRQDDTLITIVYENKNIESYTIQDNHLVMMNDDNTLNADFTLARK